jgi:hypothetical protein
MKRKPGHCRGCETAVPRREIRRSKIQALACGLDVATVDDLLPRCPGECLEMAIRQLVNDGEEAA